MPRFDLMQKTVFNAATALYGDVASWTPKAGGPTQTAKVLFNDPTEKRGLDKSNMPNDFNPDACRMEYKTGDFVGLLESVNKKNVEHVSYGGNRYQVTSAKRKWDGKTFYLNLILTV